MQRPMTPRDDRKYIVFPDRYRRLDRADFDEMYRDEQERFAKNPDRPDGITNVGQANYVRKFAADFSMEMTRSVQAIPPGLGVSVILTGSILWRTPEVAIAIHICRKGTAGP